MSLNEKLDDNWSAFKRDREMLLRDYREKYVAYKGGELIANSTNFDELIAILRQLPYNRKGSNLFVGKVNEEYFEELSADIPGIVHTEL